MRRASAIAALWLVPALASAGCREEGGGPATLATRPLATIVFEAPTDAWVGTGGTVALWREGDDYVLGEFDTAGEVAVHPVAAGTLVGDDHRVYQLAGPPPALVVDSVTLVLAGTEYRDDGCYWCTVPFPTRPVVADAHDGTWSVTVGAGRSTVAQPAGWDGRPPEGERAPDGAAVLAARTTGSNTVVIDGGRVCRVAGTWRLLAVTADGYVLGRVDPARLDASTVTATRCA